MIEFVFAISVMLNSALLFYSVRLARRLLIVSVNINAVYEIFDAFKTHVEEIHEAEMFYGDQTLQALINHSKGVLDSLDDYSDLMALVGTEEEGDGEEEE
jgi:hypothetical protein